MKTIIGAAFRGAVTGGVMIYTANIIRPDVLNHITEPLSMMALGTGAAIGIIASMWLHMFGIGRGKDFFSSVTLIGTTAGAAIGTQLTLTQNPQWIFQF